MYTVMQDMLLYSYSDVTGYTSQGFQKFVSNFDVVRHDGAVKGGRVLLSLWLPTLTIQTNINCLSFVLFKYSRYAFTFSSRPSATTKISMFGSSDAIANDVICGFPRIHKPFKY